MGATGGRRVGADPGATEPGLAVLYDALERATARLALSGLAVAIEDRVLGRQCFAGGPEARRAHAALAADGAREWLALPAVEETPVDLDALRALASVALRLAVADPGADALAAVEVAMRSHPGVTTVCRSGGALHVEVEPGRRDEVLGLLATASKEGTAGVVLLETRDGGSDVTPMPAFGRPELVAVRSLPEAGELEVHLRRADRRTVGRAPLAGSGTAAATATLDALRELAPDTSGAITLRVAWARTVDTTPEREFLVAVALRREDGGTLYGLAAGSSPIEAGARAALHACNRLRGQSTTTGEAEGSAI